MRVAFKQSLTAIFTKRLRREINCDVNARIERTREKERERNTLELCWIFVWQMQQRLQFVKWACRRMRTCGRANIVTDNWCDFANSRISYRNIKMSIIRRDTRRLSFRIAFPAIIVSSAETQLIRTDRIPLLFPLRVRVIKASQNDDRFNNRGLMEYYFYTHRGQYRVSIIFEFQCCSTFSLCYIINMILSKYRIYT